MMSFFPAKLLVLGAVCASLQFSSCSLVTAATKVSDTVKDQVASALKLVGKISINPDALISSTKQGMMVVAQNLKGETLRAFTDSSGGFSLDVPDSLRSNEFIVSLVDASGAAVGPLMNSTVPVVNNARSLGMAFSSQLSQVDFGSISVAASGLVETASGVNGVTSVSDLVARVTAQGAPVGLVNHGKDLLAKATSLSARQLNDRDQDGLIDLLDADDDGDGVLDDFDTDTLAVGMPTYYSVDVGFWLNPSDQDYRTFYKSGAELRNLVKGKYILELWFNVRNTAEANTITNVALDTRSMPAYMPLMQDGPEQSPHDWSLANYQMQGVSTLPEGGKLWKTRVAVKVGSQADIRAGDLFNFLVTKTDGTTMVVSQMLNFVFNNIPLLDKIGTNPNSLTDVRTSMTTGDPSAPFTGSTSSPVMIPDGQDLILKFKPPVDDLNNPILQGSYRISVTVYRPDGTQVQQIAPVAAGTGYYNNNHLQLDINIDQMTYDAAAGLFTVVIPKGCFPNSVSSLQGDTTPFTPDRYSIGIVALVKQSQSAFTVFVKK